MEFCDAGISEGDGAAGEVVERLKALGDIRDISYIYLMLYRFGIIEVPENVAKKMALKRPVQKGE